MDSDRKPAFRTHISEETRDGEDDVIIAEYSSYRLSSLLAAAIKLVESHLNDATTIR